MKVIHFIASIDKSGGGTTSYMQLLAEELRHYAEVKIATIKSENPVEIPHVDVAFFEFSLFNRKSFSQKVKAYLIAQQPDLVHLNGIWNPEVWFFQKEAQKLGIKIVLSPHGMLEPYILNRNPLKKKLALFLYQHKSIKKAEYIHATAQAELDNIQKLGYQNKNFIVPNGIKIADIKPKESYNSDHKHFLFLSRVHPKKGIDLLIEAVHQMAAQNFKITIAGNGDESYVKELEALAKNKNVAHLFDFVGPVYGEDKRKLYLSADVFVLPTYSENFGIVIAESLIYGVPVITTQGTPWGEIADHNCGWWIDLTIENLKNTLIEALQTSHQELAFMGSRGRHLIQSKYDIVKVAKDISDEYKKIVDHE